MDEQELMRRIAYLVKREINTAISERAPRVLYGAAQGGGAVLIDGNQGTDYSFCVNDTPTSGRVAVLMIGDKLFCLGTVR